MRTLTSSFIALKNKLEGTTFVHLVELEINANITAYFTSHPETITAFGNTYMPVPMVIGVEEQNTTGELPTMSVDVWNYQGMAFRFAKDNDLSLNDVTIRLVNLDFLTDSGAVIKLQILGSAFTNEVGRFILGYGFNYDAEGPRPVWNRRDHPSIPFNFRQFAIV